jgi:hypothetical protein
VTQHSAPERATKEESQKIRKVVEREAFVAAKAIGPASSLKRMRHPSPSNPHLRADLQLAFEVPRSDQRE